MTFVIELTDEAYLHAYLFDENPFTLPIPPENASFDIIYAYAKTFESILTRSDDTIIVSVTRAFHSFSSKEFLSIEQDCPEILNEFIGKSVIVFVVKYSSKPSIKLPLPPNLLKFQNINIVICPLYYQALPTNTNGNQVTKYT